MKQAPSHLFPHLKHDRLIFACDWNIKLSIDKVNKADVCHEKRLHCYETKAAMTVITLKYLPLRPPS